MKYTYRTYIGEVFCEVVVSKDSKGTIIYCPGLPDIPKESSFMLKISELGYNIIYPRYRGTYESDGVFLDKSPSQDIKDIIQYFSLNKNFKELYNENIIEFDLGNVKLLASSFGGIVAVDIAMEFENIDLVLVSPLLEIDDDMKKELNFLKFFLKRSYRNVYRFDDNNFDKLESNKFFFFKNINNLNMRINIFHGVNDKTININDIRRFAKNKSNIRLIELDSGHMRVSSIPLHLIKEALEK